MFNLLLLFFLFNSTLNGADCLNRNLVDHITDIQMARKIHGSIEGKNVEYRGTLSNGSVVVASRYNPYFGECSFDEYSYSCVLQVSEANETVVEESKNPKDDFEIIEEMFSRSNGWWR